MARVATALSHLARRLARRPGFTAAAVATLALGIGANLAIFSVIRVVLLAPLPFPQPEDLVALGEAAREELSASAAPPLGAVSPPNFVDFQAQAEAFHALAAVNGESFTLTGPGEPAELLPGASVTGGFFEVLGVAPALGRAFSAAELQPGGPPAVVLGHGLWQRRYGADPEIVGRRIEVDGAPAEVAGVMPAGFSFPEESELWAAMAFSEETYATQRGAHYLEVYGRLATGASIVRANAELGTIARRLEAEHPEQNTGVTALAVPLRDALVGEYRRALWMLFAAVGLVLLIACSNVANLLLARTLERRQELSVRAALGAPAGRIVRDVLGESAALAALGGAAAVGIAALALGLLTSLQGLDMPRLEEARLDPPVLLFAGILTLATALLAGLLPALRLTGGRRLFDGLGGGRATEDRSSRRLRGGLVVAETALAVVLVFGAGLLARSSWNLHRVEPGFDPEGVLTFRILLNENDYPEPNQRSAFVEELLTRAERHPGVSAAGAVNVLPFSGMNYMISVEELDGGPAYDQPGEEQYVYLRVATPEYFRALGVPLRAGRSLGEADRHGAPPAVVVNETAARLLWPGGSPLGHTVEVGTSFGVGRGRAGGEVVGVVGDVRHASLASEPLPEMYVAHAQFPVDWLTLVLRTDRDPALLVEEMRRLVAEADPNLPIFQVRSMEERLAESMADHRLYTFLLGLFAATALTLAAVGTYGVLAYSASQRVREVGIRMALGASRERIVTLLLRQGLGLALAGLLLGGLAAAWAGELLSTWLFGLEPTDPLTLAATALLLGAAAVAASLSPALRASRVEPVETLQQQ